MYNHAIARFLTQILLFQSMPVQVFPLSGGRITGHGSGCLLMDITPIIPKLTVLHILLLIMAGMAHHGLFPFQQLMIPV